MALKGLKRYGYNETAEACREQLLAWCHQNHDRLWEYYDSSFGKGKERPAIRLDRRVRHRVYFQLGFRRRSVKYQKTEALLLWRESDRRILDHR